LILHHLEPTAILDYDSPAVIAFTRSIDSGASETAVLRAAHAAIASHIRPATDSGGVAAVPHRGSLVRPLGSFEDTWKRKAFEALYADRPSV
jgi:hypothetical protein